MSLYQKVYGFHYESSSTQVEKAICASCAFAIAWGEGYKETQLYPWNEKRLVTQQQILRHLISVHCCAENKKSFLVQRCVHKRKLTMTKDAAVRHGPRFWLFNSLKCASLEELHTFLKAFVVRFEWRWPEAMPEVIGPLRNTVIPLVHNLTIDCLSFSRIIPQLLSCEWVCVWLALLLSFARLMRKRMALYVVALLTSLVPDQYACQSKTHFPHLVVYPMSTMDLFTTTTYQDVFVGFIRLIMVLHSAAQSS